MSVSSLTDIANHYEYFIEEKFNQELLTTTKMRLMIETDGVLDHILLQNPRVRRSISHAAELNKHSQFISVNELNSTATLKTTS